MKPSIAGLYILVTLSLAVSLTTLLIVTQNNDNFTSNQPVTTPNLTTTPPYMPPITNEPQPTSTSPQTSLTLTYTETNRVENNGVTKVTLTVDITYNNGDAITVNYSQLYLKLYIGRNIMYMPGGITEPKNSGSFNIGSSHRTQTFQLNFEFSTTLFNGMDTGGVYYELQYNGPATIQWTNQKIQ